jgi:activin receptor type-2
LFILIELTKPPEAKRANQKRIIIIIVSACITVLVVAFFALFLKWYWSVCRRPPDPVFDREDIELSQIRSSSIEMLTARGSNLPTALSLSEKIGVGRFAEVWRGKFLTEDVAVKVFFEAERPSWIAEVNAYIKPMKLRHESLLRFWFAEKHFGDNGPEFWLITDYHECGSLCDYLKVTVITLEELCNMALSLAAGMTYLHSRIANNEGVKPVIAHRDIKSRNVLIKRNKTCCISDFGLSIKFKHGQKATEAHGQVGTVRYMAPEVLEGAISFQEQSFLRTDIYAVALVLWEMASRCSIGKGVLPL